MLSDGEIRREKGWKKEKQRKMYMGKETRHDANRYIIQYTV